jgi:hypothetical protein
LRELHHRASGGGHPNLREYVKRHSDLVGVAAAVGVICAADFLGRRLEHGRVNDQINLIGNTVSQFDSLVQQYVTLALENDSKVAEYCHSLIDDPRVEEMNELRAMPISHWPSNGARRAFNEVTFSSTMLMEMSDEDTSIKLRDRISTYERNFDTLKKTLDASRR